MTKLLYYFNKLKFKLFRLILFLLLIISFCYISTFFTISFNFMGVDLYFMQLFIILFLLYLLLEYREYVYQTGQNEFYKFFFWLLYLICIFVLYISYIKVFILTENLYDFILQSKYLTIQILYTTEYKIQFFKDTILKAIEMFDMPEEKKQIVLKNISIIVDKQIFENKNTLIILQNYAVSYIHIASQVYDAMPFLTQKYDLFLFKQTTNYQLYSLFRNLFFIFTSISSIKLFYYNILIKYYLAKHLYKYVFFFLQAAIPDYINDMPMDVIIDKCKAVAELIIKYHDSRQIISFVNFVKKVYNDSIIILEEVV